MPNGGKPIDAFLSHSHGDAVWVENLARKLEDNYGFKIWLDRWTLIPGKSWQQAMARGLDDAASCAVCVGDDTPQGWFREEIERALDMQTRNGEFRVYLSCSLTAIPRIFRLFSRSGLGQIFEMDRILTLPCTC